MIEGVIFDLWNTLIEPRDEFHTMKLIQEQYKIPLGVYREEVKKKLMTRPLEDVKEITKFMQEEYGLPPRSKKEKDDLQKQIGYDTNKVALYPDTIDTLKQLKDRKIKIGLISNASSPHKKPFFRFGLEEYFDHLCFSCDIGYWKPEKEIYHKTLKNMSLKPENTLMIGDNKIKDYQTPNSLGMIGIHLDRRKDSDADRKVDELHEVAKYIC